MTQKIINRVYSPHAQAQTEQAQYRNMPLLCYNKRTNH